MVLNSKALFCYLLLILPVLSGCPTDPVRPPTEVKVAVPTPRKVKVPNKPIMPLDSASRKDPLEVNLKKALAEIELRRGYEKELETAVSACNKDNSD